LDATTTENSERSTHDGKGGGKPRGAGVGGVASEEPRRPVIDSGWDDYMPPDPAEIAAGRGPRPFATRRDYRKDRFSGLSPILRFIAFGSCSEAWSSAPLLRRLARREERHCGLGGRNPTALQLPFVSDIVRGSLWSSISQPVDATDTEVVPS